MKKMVALVLIGLMMSGCGSTSSTAEVKEEPAAASSAASTSEDSASESAASAESAESASEATPEATPEETPEPTPEETPDPTDEFSAEQKNAYKAALNYLEYSGFSKAGLVDQLSSEYGDKYPVEVAEFAVQYLEDNDLVDWQAEAIESAQSYLEFSGFSRTGLIDQLSSEYGDKYTAEEAAAAVQHLEDNSLVDWKEEAVQSAQSYLEYSEFSREGLIDQLTSEYGDKFTAEEAEYAVSQVYDG